MVIVIATPLGNMILQHFDKDQEANELMKLLTLAILIEMAAIMLTCMAAWLREKFLRS